jgi:hypothetical protein
MQCGPLSSIVDFSELTGAELVPTLKREIVSHGMFYDCANIKKFKAREGFVARVQIRLYNTGSRLTISAGSA